VGGCVVGGSSFPISTFCARTRHGQNNPSLTAYARRLRSPCPTSHRPTPARRPDQCLSSFFPPLPMLQPVRSHIEHKARCGTQASMPVKLTEALLLPPCPLALRELDGILGAFSCERAAMRRLPKLRLTDGRGIVCEVAGIVWDGVAVWTCSA